MPNFEEIKRTAYKAIEKREGITEAQKVIFGFSRAFLGGNSEDATMDFAQRTMAVTESFGGIEIQFGSTIGDGFSLYLSSSNIEESLTTISIMDALLQEAKGMLIDKFNDAPDTDKADLSDIE